MGQPVRSAPLSESSCFKVMAKPGEYGNSTWHFSRDEVLKFRYSYLNGLQEVSGEYWAFQQILQFFGGQIERSLITILHAIDDGSVKAFAKGKKLSGLSSMLFKKRGFFERFEDYKMSCKVLSIAAISKILCIQQQLTYQLVEAGLISVASKPDSKIRWARQEDIDKFRSKYTVLSKLAKKHRLTQDS